MHVIEKGYTEEDLERLSAQGYRYELIQGDLRQMLPIGMQHAYITNLLASYVSIYAEEHDLGAGFVGELGCIVTRNPDTILAPDWAFYAKNRLPERLTEKFTSLIPDIVLETRSPNDTKPEVNSKVQRWLEAGVGAVWELDPNARALMIYRTGSQPVTLDLGDELTDEELLPGFTLPIRRLFREIAR